MQSIAKSVSSYFALKEFSDHMSRFGPESLAISQLQPSSNMLGKGAPARAFVLLNTPSIPLSEVFSSGDFLLALVLLMQCYRQPCT